MMNSLKIGFLKIIDFSFFPNFTEGLHCFPAFLPPLFFIRGLLYYQRI